MTSARGMDTIKLGAATVGEGFPCYIIAELGINANGSVETAKRLIAAAAEAGADAVKVQVRDVETTYGRVPHPPGFLDRERVHPLSEDQTQRGQKLALEFSMDEHRELAAYARGLCLDYTASCWDEVALARFVEAVDPPWIKVASASILDRPLMRAHARLDRPLVISTGMATLADVLDCVDTIDVERAQIGLTENAQIALLHCCSTYPAPDDELNLNAIRTMAREFGIPIGYSGHERGISPSSTAVALGACIVERHITLDRAAYGSDQAASLEPQGFRKMVRDIRTTEAALGDGVKRPQPSEEEAARKLRRVVE